MDLEIKHCALNFPETYFGGGLLSVLCGSEITFPFLPLFVRDDCYRCVAVDCDAQRQLSGTVRS